MYEKALQDASGSDLIKIRVGHPFSTAATNPCGPDVVTAVNMFGKCTKKDLALVSAGVIQPLTKKWQ